MYTALALKVPLYALYQITVTVIIILYIDRMFSIFWITFVGVTNGMDIGMKLLAWVFKYWLQSMWCAFVSYIPQHVQCPILFPCFFYILCISFHNSTNFHSLVSTPFFHLLSARVYSIVTCVDLYCVFLHFCRINLTASVYVSVAYARRPRLFPCQGSNGGTRTEKEAQLASTIIALGP